MRFVIAFCLLASGLLPAQSVPREVHPRPDFQRSRWRSLNGSWDFRFDPGDTGLKERWWEPGKDFGNRKITVPFCWESALSGVQDTSGQKIGWYRRTFRIPAAWSGSHAWLRFDAVDWEARVWVNGKEIGTHAGGYTPFEFDLAGAAKPGQDAVVVVRAFDATDPELPRGKQNPRWYTYTSGIWQTVWLEARPAYHIRSFTLTPRRNGDRWQVDLELRAEGGGGLPLQISAPEAGIESREVPLTNSIARTTLEVANPRPWTPETPVLYNLTFQLGQDTVQTYFGLRTIARGRYTGQPYESILLNGDPVYLRGALDQSFNPKGIYTAPSDAFLRGDMELAKSLGLNCLRIHIKADEPRRLYWADRTGILIMQDMPSMDEHSLRGREAWEKTMRDVVERDRNHLAIFAWVAFNETWGLNYADKKGARYPENRDTQQWVERMWKEMKAADPSRLVEDNSADKRDHVITDLNSWHFYIGEYEAARSHIEEVVFNTHPGSSFNYVPGRTQGTEPLINSEYGAVSAGGGDRDVSWGFHFLTNELRRHTRIQGYVYTELSDIEWEHNGFLNYDRTPKDFGYDAWVPGMTVSDLQGPDFIGYDGPPVIQAAPGSELSISLFISHFSPPQAGPTLRWRIIGTNDLGAPIETRPATRLVDWKSYGVGELAPLRVRLPGKRPFVGAVALELLDSRGRRLAANFVNVVARTAPGPRVEVLGPRLVALRFAADAPQERQTVETRPGKLWTAKAAEFTYRVPVPGWLEKAQPEKVEFLAEIATHAGEAKLDWPARKNPLDYPQTDARKFPGKVGISLAGVDAGEVKLADDPADAGGVLSSMAGFHHGSHGYLARVSAKARPLPEIAVHFTAAQGLSIYGEGMGRYGFNPVLLVHTARDVDQPVGWSSPE